MFGCSKKASKGPDVEPTATKEETTSGELGTHLKQTPQSHRGKNPLKRARPKFCVSVRG